MRQALTAHDIGLTDLLDAAYLTGGTLALTVLAISIDPLQARWMEPSPSIAERIPKIARLIIDELLPARKVS